MANYETRIRLISETNVNVANNTSYVTVALDFRRTDYQYYGYNLDGNAYWIIKVDSLSTGNVNLHLTGQFLRTNGKRLHEEALR